MGKLTLIEVINMVLERCFQMLQDRFIKMLNLNSIWKIYENLTFHNQNISLLDIDR